MSWIKSINQNDATGPLKKLYDRVVKSLGKLESIVIAQGIRPSSLESFLIFSDSLLYSKENRLPQWLIESIGIYVGYLNGSEYCVEHHYDKLKTSLPAKNNLEKIRSALAEDQPGEVFDVWEEAIMKYTKKLTQNPSGITIEDIEELRLCGLEDEEILEVNQVVGFFAFTNRIALGLGVSAEDNLLELPVNNNNK